MFLAITSMARARPPSCPDKLSVASVSLESTLDLLSILKISSVLSLVENGGISIDEAASEAARGSLLHVIRISPSPCPTFGRLVWRTFSSSMLSKMTNQLVSSKLDWHDWEARGSTQTHLLFAAIEGQDVDFCRACCSLNTHLV